jgi:phosphoglycerol transferase MdoB-like AlkP superfamily enzyme
LSNAAELRKNLWRCGLWLAAILAWSFVAVFAAVLAVRFGFLQKMRMEGVPPSAWSFAALTCLLAPFQRRLIGLLILEALLVTILYLGNGLKQFTLGTPILPGDFAVMGEFIHVISLGNILGLVALPCLMIFVFLWNFRWKPVTVPMAGIAGAVVAVWGFAAAAPALAGQMDRHFAFGVLSPWENFIRNGPLVFLAREKARDITEHRNVPGRITVAEAVAGLNLQGSGPDEDPSRPRRNLYWVTLESFWDVSELSGYEFSEPPVDPRFAAMLAPMGDSRFLSPTFGGGTANAEFAALCGIPALGQLEFTVNLTRNMHCLPRLLAEHGWVTEAAHPNAGDFFSRATAYPRIGFQRTRFVKDFVLDETAGEMLSDASLFRQNLAHISEELASSDAPHFFYVMTFASHYPYPPVEGQEHLITSDPPDEIVSGYATATRRLSAAAADYVEELRRIDPDGVIVMFGDHKPSFGAGRDGRRMVGFPDDTGGPAPPGAWVELAETPILVIDGRNGVVPVGQMPAWMLTRRIAEIVGLRAEGLLALSPPAGTSAAHVFTGRLLLRENGGSWVDCGAAGAIETEPCLSGGIWRNRVATIKRDAMSGDGHAAAIMNGSGEISAQ